VAKPMPLPGAEVRPAVQHLVVRYAKRGKMRFASHRDVARVFERGVRRAGLPIAYSAGFTPHPKISYVGGAPTGVASEAEYLSLALTSPQDADAVRERLDAVLPDGIDVVDVTQEAPGGRAGTPEASLWHVSLPGIRPEAAMRAAAGFLALAEAPVERLTDKGVRRMDARSAVTEMSLLRDPSADDPGDRRVAVTAPQDCAILRMVILHMAPAVRPEDVLTALSAGFGIVPSSPPLVTRLAQGPLATLANSAEPATASPRGRSGEYAGGPLSEKTPSGTLSGKTAP
jgi:radical SAM-linked protein